MATVQRRDIKKNMEFINQITENKTLFWASRIEVLWDKLIPEQAKSINSESFYTEDEKPTQNELASELA
jgi:hypothetical protein